MLTTWRTIPGYVATSIYRVMGYSRKLAGGERPRSVHQLLLYNTANQLTSSDGNVPGQEIGAYFYEDPRGNLTKTVFNNGQTTDDFFYSANDGRLSWQLHHHEENNYALYAVTPR